MNKVFNRKNLKKLDEILSNIEQHEHENNVSKENSFFSTNKKDTNGYLVISSDSVFTRDVEHFRNVLNTVLVYMTDNGKDYKFYKPLANSSSNIDSDKLMVVDNMTLRDLYYINSQVFYDDAVGDRTIFTKNSNIYKRASKFLKEDILFINENDLKDDYKLFQLLQSNNATCFTELFKNRIMRTRNSFVNKNLNSDEKMLNRIIQKILTEIFTFGMTNSSASLFRDCGFYTLRNRSLVNKLKSFYDKVDIKISTDRNFIDYCNMCTHSNYFYKVIRTESIHGSHNGFITQDDKIVELQEKYRKVYNFLQRRKESKNDVFNLTYKKSYGYENLGIEFYTDSIKTPHLMKIIGMDKYSLMIPEKFSFFTENEFWDFIREDS